MEPGSETSSPSRDVPVEPALFCVPVFDRSEKYAHEVARTTIRSSNNSVRALLLLISLLLGPWPTWDRQSRATERRGEAPVGRSRSAPNFCAPDRPRSSRASG